MKRVFYDIESLKDAFTVAIWHPDGIPHVISYENIANIFSPLSYQRIFNADMPSPGTQDPYQGLPVLDLYVLKDDVYFDAADTVVDSIKTAVFARNPVLRNIAREHNLAANPYPFNDITVRVFDLHKPLCAAMLILEFGIGSKNRRIAFTVKNPDNPDAYIMTTDEDTPFDFETDKVDHDVYLMGYNSYNYDTTMLAFYIASIVNVDDSMIEIRNLKRNIESYLTKISIADTKLYGDNPDPEIEKDIAYYEAAIESNEARIKQLEHTQLSAQIDQTKFEELTPYDLRAFNDILFSKAFVRQMPSALAFDAITDYSDSFLTVSGNTSRYHREPSKMHKGWTRALCAQKCADANSLPQPRYRNYDLFEHNLRQFWMRSGRHIDVARLNEKQQRVGLKRLLGVIGRQIFEDPSVINGQMQSIENLMAYNASDVINLQFIFENGAYRAPFDNKAMILDEYPETVFVNPKAEGNLLTRPENVRNDRLRIDSTSQQIIATALCPDRTKPLMDKETVNLNYPHELMAEEKGIQTRDILEESADYFYQQVFPTIKPEYRALALYQFERAYQHYDWLRGKNLNDGRAYKDHYPDQTRYNNPPGIGTCILYFDKNGEPSSCYAIISEGGVHGAEYDKRLYADDVRTYERARSVLEKLQSIFGEGDAGATNMMNTGVKVIKSDPICYPGTDEPIIFDDGNPRYVKDVVMSKSTRKAAYWKKISRPQLFRMTKIQQSTENRIAGTGFPDNLDITLDGRIKTLKERYGTAIDFEAIAQEIAANPDRYNLKFRSDELNSRYAYTSAATTNHEDFESYYPNLLRQMRAFYNEDLGMDRYGEIFGQKQTFGKYQKDPTLAPEELQKSLLDLTLNDQCRYWTRRRNGVKLMLNAGSGAGGATFDNAIRMNNNIMAMRMIGQMFTWRIGQAQSLKGASVPSTNTDGLYTVMEATANNAILEHEAATIGVNIEPEVIQLVSKDANNRVEYELHDGITSAVELVNGELVYHPERVNIVATGGSLSCWRGPSTTNSLDHPALYDYVMTHYVIAIKECAEWEHAHHFGVTPDESLENCIDRWFRDGFYDNIAMTIINALTKQMSTRNINDQVHVLRMFQTMVSSSPGSYSFVVERRYDPMTDSVTDFRNMQHYNRIFFVDPNKIDPISTLHLSYLSKCTARKTEPNEKAENQYYGKAVRLLREMGIEQSACAAEGRRAAILKLTKIDPEQLVTVENSDLYVMGERTDENGFNGLENLFAILDIDAYLSAIRDIYNKNWRNRNVPAPSYAAIAYGQLSEQAA